MVWYEMKSCKYKVASALDDKSLCAAVSNLTNYIICVAPNTTLYTQVWWRYCTWESCSINPPGARHPGSPHWCRCCRPRPCSLCQAPDPAKTASQFESQQGVATATIKHSMCAHIETETEIDWQAKLKKLIEQSLCACTWKMSESPPRDT